MAEELWLWRLRQPSPSNAPGGMTMAEAAKFLGISLQRYKNLEAGRRINIAMDELPSLNFLRVPRPELSLREQCILARRRSGLFIREIAEEYGFSHTRVLTHEDMAARRLIDYWTAKGFHGWLMPPEMVVAPVAPVAPRPMVLSPEQRAQNYNEARAAIDAAQQESAPLKPARPRLTRTRRQPEAEEPQGPRLIETERRPASPPSLVRRGVVIEPPAPPPPARPQLKPRRQRHAA
jgi:DNA-binding CsgD family transcriptional regulator